MVSGERVYREAGGRIFSRGILSRRSSVSLCEAGSPALSDDDGSHFRLQNIPHSAPTSPLKSFSLRSLVTPPLFRRLSPSEDTQVHGSANRLPPAADAEFPIDVIQVFFYGFR